MHAKWNLMDRSVGGDPTKLMGVLTVTDHAASLTTEDPDVRQAFEDVTRENHTMVGVWEYVEVAGGTGDRIRSVPIADARAVEFLLGALQSRGVTRAVKQ